MHQALFLIVHYREGLLKGALTSIELAAISWSAGLLLGTPLGIWRALRGHGAAKGGVALFSAVASSVPVMVYLLWCYYPLQTILGISLSPFITAATVFAFYNVLIVGEVVRSAVADLPISLGLSARVSGVSNPLFVRYVLLPLAWRAALPGYLVSQVGALHMTLFASLISVNELFRVVQQINAVEYNAVGVFSLLALFYFILSFPLLLVAFVANKRLAKLGLDK
jgi:polar amino acid transport system permease protein